MENESITVSVIIPTYKDTESLFKCLLALSNQTYSHCLLEVIVVNNDPENNVSVSKFKHDYELIIIDELKPGSYAARNKGVITSSGQIVAFTDSDCIPSPKWIECGVRSLLHNKDSSRIGGRINIFQEAGASKLAWLYDKIFSFNQKSFVEEKGYSVTANLFCYSSLFEKVGLFDETLLSGGDTVWGLKAHSMGEKITYASDAIVYHPARLSVADIKKKMKRVSGGIYSRNITCDSPVRKKLAFLVKSCKPPVSSYLKIIFHESPGCVEKLKLCIIATDLRVLRIYVFAKILLGIEPPERS